LGLEVSSEYDLFAYNLKKNNYLENFGDLLKKRLINLIEKRY